MATAEKSKTPPLDGASSSTQADDEFFLDDSFVTIRAGGTLFRLPSSKLNAESQYFRRLSSQTESLLKTSSNENPFKLPTNVSAEDFKLLLRLMNLSFGANTVATQVQYSKQDWRKVLRLSSLWAFSRIRKDAIKNLHQVGLAEMEKVLLGREYSISQWVKEGYLGLVTRTTTISSFEATSIGLDAVVKLFQMRETRALAAGSAFSRVFFSTEESSIHRLAEIEKAFRQELAGIELLEGRF
ncbi:hypothetical protein CPB83DRAFT_852576 [Crepidotus variabilis]|uniref:BTB domain-containing protein n=1 Tax=Crepidotus variabilis TaxID=179855 RepID=A0A9P6EHV3_9AGAR|nr:hypothetical protein CPB83DRAFT_852576 [Crepidotus variabilis]